MKLGKGVLAAVLVLAWCPLVFGGIAIPVVNGSFEVPDVAPGNPVSNPVGVGVQGWVFTYWKPASNGNLYIWDIVSPFSEFASGIPDGSQVAGGAGAGLVVEIGQGFDVDVELGDKYIAAVNFGKSNTWGGTHASMEMALIDDAAVVVNLATDVNARSWENDFVVPDGDWVDVRLPLWVYEAEDVGKDIQIELRAQDNMSFDNVRLYKVADNPWVGTVGNWNIPGDWQNGIPAYHDFALVTNSGTVNMSSGAEAYGLKIDGGGSLTISSGGQLDLIANQVPAAVLGITGDAELIIDGGVLNHGAEFGGDFKAGTADGVNVNVEVRSGTLNARNLRLGESGVEENWAPAEAVVLSDVTMTQTGGLVDCTAVRADGRVYLAYSAGAKATYTMNGGTLRSGYIVLCANGDFADVPEGTFNLVDGIVELGNDLVLGATSNRNHATFNQSGGALSIAGDLQAAVGLDTSRFSISGGQLSVAGDVTFGSGAGVFEVVGSDPNMSVGGYVQNGYSTLKVQIDAGGVTAIDVAGTAVFEAGAVLDVSLAGGGVPGTYNVLVADGGITDNGINNWSADCDHVSYAIVNGGTTLAVTYHADSDPGRCGQEPEAICVQNPPYDFTGDCRVDLADFATFAGSWLSCGLNDPLQCD